MQTIHKQALVAFLSVLAYLDKQAQDNQRLPYACLLSTKGAYYVANKQAQIEAKPSISPSVR
jgi:hypothetical protein